MMKRIIFLALGLICAALLYGQSTSASSKPASSSMFGVFDENEEILLKPAFINAVNHYLRRYNPRLLGQNETHVKMTAKYDYELDIELFVNEKTYEIIVSTSNKKYSGKMQNVCAKIVGGVNKTFENYLIRGTRTRDRTDSQGLR